MDKKFKIGDKVVLINKNVLNDKEDLSSKNIKSKLNNILKIIEIGKIYIIKDIFKYGDDKILIKINVDENFYFNKDRFISLKEYRKQKINKINEKC
jgi:hypothetical protein